MVAGRWNLLWCWLEVTETDRPGSYALLFTFYWKARIVIYQMIYFSPYVDNSMVSFSDFLCILLFSSLKRKGIFCFKNTLSTYYHILTKILFSRRRKKRNIWKTVSSLVSFTRALMKNMKESENWQDKIRWNISWGNCVFGKISNVIEKFNTPIFVISTFPLCC